MKELGTVSEKSNLSRPNWWEKDKMINRRVEEIFWKLPAVVAFCTGTQLSDYKNGLVSFQGIRLKRAQSRAEEE